MGILQNICNKLDTEEAVMNLVKSNSVDKIYKVLTGRNNEN
jgi:mannitol/fructose-specific phosphotransferase system IIA component (Ntr-type)